jgi:hypothetical protein
VMFRDNKGMNCFENYKGNLEAPKNEVECWSCDKLPLLAQNKGDSLWGCSSVVECLSTHKALGSISSTPSPIKIEDKAWTIIKKFSYVWCHSPLIPVARRLKQENCEFEASLRYTVRLYLKIKINK